MNGTNKQENNMHPNEVKITEDNVKYLTDEAMRLGHGHLTALTEQMSRQNFSSFVPLKELK